MTKILYTAVATAEGGRDGRVASDDGQLDVRVATPPELGGPGGGTNPEQLFAAGFSACFHSAMTLVARRARVDVSGSTVTGRVGIGPREGAPGYGLTVHLRVEIPGLSAEEAQALVERADKVCPYSNAVRGNVTVTHEVVTGAAVTS
jgi:osmotically inducible protein OsmC